MKLKKSDLPAVRGVAFTDWRQIIDRVLERRHHIEALLEERRRWGAIQAMVGMEE